MRTRWISCDRRYCRPTFLTVINRRVRTRPDRSTSARATIAQSLPEARLVGVDLSPRQVADGAEKAPVTFRRRERQHRNLRRELREPEAGQIARESAAPMAREA